MNENIGKYKHIKPNFGSRNKTILMYHGWGSTIDSQVVIGEKLANLGFDIVIPEIIYHDTRQPLKNPFEKTTMQNYFWKTIFNSIDEINDLLKCLNVAKENTILFGSSMGGFISSGIFFSDIGFSGLVNINGSSSFIVSENIFRERDMRESLEQDELKNFKQYDPKFKPLKTNSPILFLHGENDQIVPIAGQKDFYLQRIEEDVRIKFITYKNVNHSITNSMVEDLIDWLENNY